MSSASLPDPLADRLDQVLPPYSTALPDHVEAEEPAVRVAVMLARGPHPALSGEAVARIQNRVLAQAGSMRRTSSRWLWRSLRWAAAACLAAAILTVGTASVSAGSVPGDTLYPVKRLVEEGRLALATNAGDVALRLDFADRRLDEFETLLNRGEVNLGTLGDALKEMNSALVLVENGDGPRDEAAIRLLSLSARQMQLAVDATAQVAPDQAKTDKLRQMVDSAGLVRQHAHDLIAPAPDSQARAPQDSILGSRDQQRRLGPESATFIATDISAAPAAIVSPAAASPAPDSRSSKPSSGGGILAGSPTPTPEPTVTLPPTDDPGSTPTPGDRPPADDPGDTPTPGDRPPADDPGDTPTPEPTVTLPPTDDPGSTPTPGDRPPADDPGDTPTPEPTVMPPPTDDPGSTPTPGDRPPADDPGDTPTPEPTVALPPTDDPGSTPTPANRPPAQDPEAAPTLELPPAGDPGSTLPVESRPNREAPAAPFPASNQEGKRPGKG